MYDHVQMIDNEKTSMNKCMKARQGFVGIENDANWGSGLDLAEHEEGRRSAASLLLAGCRSLWLARMCSRHREGVTSSARAQRGHCFRA